MILSIFSCTFLAMCMTSLEKFFCRSLAHFLTGECFVVVVVVVVVVVFN